MNRNELIQKFVQERPETLRILGTTNRENCLRNRLCPCGSLKKIKKCCGVRKLRIQLEKARNYVSKVHQDK